MKNASIAGVRIPLTAITVVGGWIMMRSVDTYFPPQLVDDDVCATLEPKPGPALDEFEAGWYGNVLRELGEAPLDGTSNEGHPVMRFTLLPSFHAAIAVRIEEQADGTAILSASRGSGWDGCEPGAADCRVVRRLSAEQWAAMSGWRARLASMAPTDCFYGVDGTRWVHESTDGKRLRVVHRHAPEDDAVFGAGVAMMRMTGWRLGTAGEWRPSPLREFVRQERLRDEAALRSERSAVRSTQPQVPLPAGP